MPKPGRPWGLPVSLNEYRLQSLWTSATLGIVQASLTLLSFARRFTSPIILLGILKTKWQKAVSGWPRWKLLRWRGSTTKMWWKLSETWNQPGRKYVGAILRWHPEWFNNPTAELAKFPVTLLQRPSVCMLQQNLMMKHVPSWCSDFYRKVSSTARAAATCFMLSMRTKTLCLCASVYI